MMSKVEHKMSDPVNFDLEEPLTSSVKPCMCKGDPINYLFLR